MPKFAIFFLLSFDAIFAASSLQDIGKNSHTWKNWERFASLILAGHEFFFNDGKDLFAQISLNKIAVKKGHQGGHKSHLFLSE